MAGPRLAGGGAVRLADIPLAGDAAAGSACLFYWSETAPWQGNEKQSAKTPIYHLRLLRLLFVDWLVSGPFNAANQYILPSDLASFDHCCAATVTFESCRFNLWVNLLLMELCAVRWRLRWLVHL